MKLQIVNAKTHEYLLEFDLMSVIRHNGRCIFGRCATSNLMLENSDFSCCHGEFSDRNGGYYFTDTGSTNGCLINTKIAIKERTYLLKAFDLIRLGGFLLIPQPLAGYEDVTDIAPVAFASLSNGAKPCDSEYSFEDELKPC